MWPFYSRTTESQQQPETKQDTSQPLPVFNYITILDKSGSMGSLGNQPVDCLNGFIADLNTSGITKLKQVVFSVYTFSSSVETVFKQLPLDQITKFTEYHPNGGTALYDAIGQALTDNKDAHNGVCHIITDGEENASRMFSLSQIQTLIKEAKAREWTFQYTGCTSDTFDTAKTLGVSQQHTVKFCASGTRGGGLNYYKSTTGQGVAAISIGMTPSKQQFKKLFKIFSNQH